ncbi:GGDEF domain-containing protein [Shewanella halifaxensis]|uniref:GGDEF domain-containing protein n=1 Tax=Shewanella halifaxensis TaxID=271098 RepID=UPI001CBB268E|nr:membrane-associated sensor domain-containing protein [Shewanella halifaxensis]
MKSYQYQPQLKREAFTILKRGILWATYVSCVLLSVVLLNSYFFDGFYFDLHSLQFKFIPLFIVLLLGLITIKLAGFENVGVKQTYLYLILLVSGWSYVLLGLALLSDQNMPGIESLADVLVLVFALALFPNRNVMAFAIFPFLAFSAVYHSMQYSQVLIYPLTKFLCFLGIILSGQKIISGWFFKAVSRNIEKKKLLQQFKRLAMIDGLTNISNRRHFDEVLTQEIKASLRNNKPLSIIMVDVDFFKPLNDSLGHQVGDKYLKRIAGVLNSALERPRDLVARYGGEEFVIALPDTDLSGATQVAEKIKQAIADTELAHPGSGVSDFITVSQGIAQWHEGMEPAQLLETADSLLYQAKSAGRDCYLSE